MLLSIIFAALAHTQQPFTVVYEGRRGPGRGKHVVLLAGDEEYRSEEGLPQLAKILALRHGFKCTVLFSIAPDGTIDPNCATNQPGLEALDTADLCITLLRFRHWPDDQMRHFAQYLKSGKPIIGLRTSTHAFDYPADSTSPYRAYCWKSTVWPGGFGKQVLGETWVSHWGEHKVQGTRGVPTSAGRSSPLLRGVDSLFGTTDVYEAAPPPNAQVLVTGSVLAGLSPTDAPAANRKRTAGGVEQEVNHPMMPIAWTRSYQLNGGNVGRAFTTTMGAATDLQNESLRRMLVNATYWAVGMEHRIPARADVRLVLPYAPSMYGFNGFKKGVTPEAIQSGRGK